MPAGPTQSSPPLARRLQRATRQRARPVLTDRRGHVNYSTRASVRGLFEQIEPCARPLCEPCGVGDGRLLNWAPGGARIALVVALTLSLSACGGAQRDVTRPVPRIQQAPPPLARLYAQPSTLRPADEKSLQRALQGLRGYPVVVNKWASWCGPCRAEFPLLREAALRLGRRVAFVGLNSEDAKGPARSFLREEPVPYPSLRDSDGALARSLGIDRIFPATVFFDRRGRRTHVKYGPYRTLAELVSDVERYAL